MLSSTGTPVTSYFEHISGTKCRSSSHARCQGRWRAEITASGHGKGRKRVKLSAGSKRELDQKVADRLAGSAPGDLTVTAATDAWIRELARRGRSPRTISTTRELTGPLVKVIGCCKVDELSVHDIEAALDKLTADRTSRTLRDTLRIMVRAMGHAQARGLCTRNPAGLAHSPAGRSPGRPSRSMTPQQATRLVRACRDWPDPVIAAYIIVSLDTTGRTEELRALRWSDVDLDAGVIRLRRSVRAGGQMKTRTSYRSLPVGKQSVRALQRLGDDHHGDELVLCTSTGTLLDPSNVRRSMDQVCEEAGIGHWSPRELRHTSVSLLSHGGLDIEAIARVAGHASSGTTERIYRHELSDIVDVGQREILDRVLDRRQLRHAGRPVITGTSSQGPGLA